MSGKIKISLSLFSVAILAGVGFWFLEKNQNGEKIVYEAEKVSDNGETETLTENISETEGVEKNNNSVEDVAAENENVADLTELEKESESVEEKEEIKEEDNGSEEENFIIDRLVSWGFQKASGRKIDTVILHTSYNILGGDEYDLEKVIKEYKQYGVAPHYVIDRSGKIYCLVADKNIAYHAGESQTPDGRTGVNNFSIGIEIINSEEDDFTKKQYQAVNELIKNLEGKYKIKYVLGHSDISPGRKTDPWNINWDKIDK